MRVGLDHHAGVGRVGHVFPGDVFDTHGGDQAVAVEILRRVFVGCAVAIVVRAPLVAGTLDRGAAEKRFARVGAGVRHDVKRKTIQKPFGGFGVDICPGEPLGDAHCQFRSHQVRRFDVADDQNGGFRFGRAGGGGDQEHFPTAERFCQRGDADLLGFVERPQRAGQCFVRSVTFDRRVGLGRG